MYASRVQELKSNLNIFPALIFHAWELSFTHFCRTDRVPTSKLSFSSTLASSAIAWQNANSRGLQMGSSLEPRLQAEIDRNSQHIGEQASALSQWRPSMISSMISSSLPSHHPSPETKVLTPFDLASLVASAVRGPLFGWYLLDLSTAEGQTFCSQTWEAMLSVVVVVVVDTFLLIFPGNLLGDVSCI